MVQTIGTVPRKIVQNPHTALTSVTDCYLAWSFQRHIYKRLTAPQLTLDFTAVSSRISKQTLCSSLAETGLCVRIPVWRVSLSASSTKDRILWR
ncbi:hypothetical protein TNCV_1884211 [Trichonephila clavipes]|nr:hypothetical protein TNCV_1884211 [Trichonephila clavipes]